MKESQAKSDGSVGCDGCDSGTVCMSLRRGREKTSIRQHWLNCNLADDVYYRPGNHRRLGFSASSAARL